MNDAAINPSINKRLIIHRSFTNTLDALKSMNVRLPAEPSPVLMDYNWINSGPTDDLVTALEEIRGYSLNAKTGDVLSHDRKTLIAGYDESINKFSALEGVAYYTSHSLVFLTPEAYEPINQLTMYFFTRSLELSKKSQGSLIPFDLTQILSPKRNTLMIKWILFFHRFQIIQFSLSMAHLSLVMSTHILYPNFRVFTSGILFPVFL